MTPGENNIIYNQGGISRRNSPYRTNYAFCVRGLKKLFTNSAECLFRRFAWQARYPPLRYRFCYDL